MGAVTVASVGAPDATARSLAIDEFAPRSPIRLPAVEVANIRAPSAQVPSLFAGIDRLRVEDVSVPVTVRGVSAGQPAWKPPETSWISPV